MIGYGALPEHEFEAGLAALGELLAAVIPAAPRPPRRLACRNNESGEIHDMIELFQITGSASFAARLALEEAGAEYETVDIHPRRRDEPASFAEVNPLKRVPALREGDVAVYETGAVLLYLADRFPGLGPAAGDRHALICIAGSSGSPEPCTARGGRS